MDMEKQLEDVETEQDLSIENTDLNVEHQETIEYIEVELPKETVIEFEESIGTSSNAEGVTHYNLPDRNEPDQHIISAITGLEDILDRLSAIKDTVYAMNGGYAEFRPWLENGCYKTDDFFNGTGGVGYFVSLVTATEGVYGNNTYIDICRKTNVDGTTATNDIYGVTVANSGFCGYQGDTNNPDYAQVGLLGNVKVRISAEEHKKISIGDYVVPNELGYASKAENGIGFKVTSKGQIETAGSNTTAWYYVEIALVPQNDNISRVMEELEKTRVNLNNVLLDLGNMSDALTNMESTTIQISGKVDGLEDILNESEIKVSEQLKTAYEVAEKAREVANQADQAINTVSMEYAEAVHKADAADKAVSDALITVNQIKQELDPLAQWQEDGTSNIAGFVAQANKDSTTLGMITQAYGTDLTGIIQKIDENGAVIQHLVAHVDKYTLGECSPADGLSADEVGILQLGIIYVPTENHREDSYVRENGSDVDFEFGKSYIWKIGDTPDVYTWVEDKPVSISTEEFDGVKEGDLWYCWKGIMEGNKYIYEPGTLYRWDDTSAGLWVAVASVNDKSNRAIGLINQTAEKLTSVYTDLSGDMSLIEQEVDEIRTLVENANSGVMSSIEQTAEEIMMGVYDSDDGNSTSLGLLLDGMTNTSTKVNIVKVKEVLAVPHNVAKYSDAPVWNGSEFVLVGEPSTDGKYYFDPNDAAPFTYYCEAADNKYYVYGVNNTAMANLSTRVTNTESEVESWTRFQKGQNETMTSINQTSDEAGAAISSMVYGDFRECVEIKLELTDEERATISTDRYDKQPKWENQKFVFEGDKIASGEYCANDETSYYKLLYRDGEIMGYEKYQMKSSPYAAVVQKVDNDGNTYAGLVAGNDSNIGSIFVESINKHSEATINADKITLNSNNETVETTLTLESGKISQIIGAVGENGEVTAASIVSSINNAESTVKIQADHLIFDASEDLKISAKNVEIDGTTTLSSLFTEGTTTIDGSKITTGTILVGDTLLNKVTSIKWNNSELTDSTNHIPLGFSGGIFYLVSEDITRKNQLEGATVRINSSEIWNIESAAILDPEWSDIKGYYQVWGNDYNNLICFFVQDNEYDGQPAGLYICKTDESKDWAFEFIPPLELFSDLLMAESDATLIDGGKIATGSITAKQIATDAIQSHNYTAPDTSTGIYAQQGTFFDLSNGSITSKNFVIDSDGKAYFKGRITAESGEIGGFSIETSSIQSVSYNANGNQTGNIYIGTNRISLGNDSFYVTNAGHLYAASAEIHGTIYAGQGGSIGGFTIGQNSISSNGVFIGTNGLNLGNGAFQVDANGNITATKGTISVEAIFADEAGLIRGFNGSTTYSSTDGICMTKGDHYIAVTEGGAKLSYFPTFNDTYINTRSQVSVAKTNIVIAAKDVEIKYGSTLKINGYQVQFEAV